MKWRHEREFAENSSKTQIIGILKIAIPLIIVVFTVLATRYFFAQREHETQVIQELVQQERAYLHITALAVENDIASMAKDLLTIKEITSVFVNDNRIREIDQLYLNMVENYQIYDQIRYIDETGMEKVRINYNDGKGEVVPFTSLQNKNDRYYYQHSHQLLDGQIYISPLDLNVEQGRVETPYKPMIRLSTPVFDSQGNRRGIVIVNYLAENILEIITSVYRGYEANLSLVNQEGFFLIHEEDKTKEFGFMFKDGSENNLAFINPEVYEKSETSQTGWFQNEKGLFNYTRIYPFRNSKSTFEEDKDVSSRSWFIITHIQQSSITTRTKALDHLSQLSILLITILTFILLVVLSILWHQKRFEHKYIKNLAHYDQLTRCYNRGWGLRLLDQILTKAKKKEVMVALLFIDLDKFKAVNDTYGHKAGDAVLTESVKRIKGLLRFDDITVRLGGDEFLVILPAIKDITVPTMVGERIHEALKEIIEYRGVDILIDSSIGIALYPEDGSTVNELISHSDRAMYQAKSNKNVPYVRFSKDSLTLQF